MGQPTLQHTGEMGPLQEQVFCSRQKPIPSLLQSVDSTVGRLVSKVFTPCFTASSISPLLFSKLSCSSWDQTNSDFGLLGDKGLGDIENPRLRRFKERCLMYDFKMIHVPGILNKVADTTSRFPGKEQRLVEILQLGATPGDD